MLNNVRSEESLVPDKHVLLHRRIGLLNRLIITNFGDLGDFLAEVVFVHIDIDLDSIAFGDLFLLQDGGISHWDRPDSSILRLIGDLPVDLIDAYYRTCQGS